MTARPRLAAFLTLTCWISAGLGAGGHSMVCARPKPGGPMHGAMSHHETMPRHGAMPQHDDEHDDHPQPSPGRQGCCCPGPCCCSLPGSSVPTAPAIDVVPVAMGRPSLDPTPATLPPRVRPFVLPWANAPPSPTT